MRSSWRALLVVVVALVVLVAVLYVARGDLVPDLVPLNSVMVDSFQRTGDPQTLVLDLVVGLGDEVAETSAREDATSVTVSVKVRPPFGPGGRPAIGILIPTTVHLQKPLGDRAVLNERGDRVRDLGMYQAPREPPVDLGQIGAIARGSFSQSGDVVDLRWTYPTTGTTRSLADLRGRTVVVTTRTSFSNEGKLTLLALQQHVDQAPADVRARIAIVVITLAEDPERAAVVRPGDTWIPLVAYSDAVDLAGSSGPEILQLRAVPTTLFIDPSGKVVRSVSGSAMTSAEVAQAIDAAR